MVDQPGNPNAVREAIEAADRVIAARQAAENAQRAGGVDGMTPEEMASAVSALKRDEQDQQKESPLAADTAPKTHQTRQSTAFDGQSRRSIAHAPKDMGPPISPAIDEEAERSFGAKAGSFLRDAAGWGIGLATAAVGIGVIVGAGPIGIAAVAGTLGVFGGLSAAALDRAPGIEGKLSGFLAPVEKFMNNARSNIADFVTALRYGRDGAPAPSQSATTAEHSDTSPAVETQQPTAEQRAVTAEHTPLNQAEIVHEAAVRTTNDAPAETMTVDAAHTPKERATAENPTATFDFGTIEADVKEAGAALDKAGVRQAERGSGEAVSADGPSHTISVNVDNMDVQR